MSISLSKKRPVEVIDSIKRFFSEKKLELELTEVQARSLITYFLHEIGPFAYNAAVQDAQRHLIRFSEDLPGACFQEPLSTGMLMIIGFDASRRTKRTCFSLGRNT